MFETARFIHKSYFIRRNMLYNGWPYQAFHDCLLIGRLWHIYCISNGSPMACQSGDISVHQGDISIHRWLIWPIYELGGEMYFCLEINNIVLYIQWIIHYLSSICLFSIICNMGCHNIYRIIYVLEWRTVYTHEWFILVFISWVVHTKITLK